MTSPVSAAMIDDLDKLEAWLADGSFYSDYDESLRLFGVFREALASMKAKEEAADQFPADEVEQVISAWAFAHNIDGAVRNDLFKRLRGKEGK